MYEPAGERGTAPRARSAAPHAVQLAPDRVADRALAGRALRIAALGALLAAAGCTTSPLTTVPSATTPSPSSGECSWTFRSPESAGIVPAAFDYNTHAGCIGPHAGSMFGFNIELEPGFRVDFGPGSETARAGAVVDLARQGSLFVAVGDWACATFTGTAIILSTANDDWIVRFDANCSDPGHTDDGEPFVGTVSGDTSHQSIVGN